ncbi:hypothetical protein MPTK1_4g10320 [Marchantia polymorpha subsp. ruderalis]|uniref:Uncharacterized protein n=2 Tax=Marchantia polymorpha TaxID=3197 RepID=A0AAF6B8F0_MARPO|nr:hypothetical protein MARPO_0011s0019 [Marchantia polymorpha]BBN08284.1 hypothetical protein Mp_4g10320 [Marchantia polymorpha subsp. ruderalis]|eukprot:PTQ46320.1 hypothetical protein MARPO_0011s0019 [Marchantia polymorpha]
MSFRSGELAIASMEVCTNTQGSVQQSPRNREGTTTGESGEMQKVSDTVVEIKGLTRGPERANQTNIYLSSLSRRRVSGMKRKPA